MMRSLATYVLFLLFATELSVSQRRGRLGADVSQTAEFDCPEEFGYYPHPSDCTQYYVCVFGGALLESCTGGLMYSHELQTCDWPRNVGCGLDGESATVSTVRVTDSRTRQGPSTSQSPSRSSVLSSRVQIDQQKRQEDELAKHHLYADDVGPAEEIESDRQQRVYRGQPSTVGQVARDRDGLRHQPVTNALPTSTGRAGVEEKIGVISFGIPQQAANTQYSYDKLTQDYNTLTNETGSREKRQVQYRLSSQAPVLQFVRSGLNLFFPSPTPVTRPTGDNIYNNSLHSNVARNNNQLTRNWNFQPTNDGHSQILSPANFNFIPRSLSSALRPPDVLAGNTDYSAVNRQTSHNQYSPVNNVPQTQVSGSFGKHKLQSSVPGEHLRPLSTAFTNLVKYFSTNIQNPRTLIPPQLTQFEHYNSTQNQQVNIFVPFKTSANTNLNPHSQNFQSYTESSLEGIVTPDHSWSLSKESSQRQVSPSFWDADFKGLDIFTPSGYNPDKSLFYSDFNGRGKSKPHSDSNEGDKYISNNYQQASHPVPTHSTYVSFSTPEKNSETSLIIENTTGSNFRPTNNAFGNAVESAENKNVFSKPIVYVGTPHQYQVEEIQTTMSSPEANSVRQEDYWDNNSDIYGENLQHPVQDTDDESIHQIKRKPRRRRLRKPKHRIHKTTQFGDGIETETTHGLSPGQESYNQAPEQYRQTVTAGESAFGPLYQSTQFYDQKGPQNNDEGIGPPASYFDSYENHKDFENPFASFDFDFDKFLDKLRGGIPIPNSASKKEKNEKTSSETSENNTQNESLNDETRVNQTYNNNENEQRTHQLNTRDDVSTTPLFTDTDYTTRVPEQIYNLENIYYTTEKSEAAIDENTRIRNSARKHTYPNGSGNKETTVNTERSNQNVITYGNISEEQTTTRPHRRRKKNKSRKQNSSRNQGDNFRRAVITTEKTTLPNLEVSYITVKENIQNTENQFINHKTLYDANKFNPIASLSPKPRERRPKKQQMTNGHVTAQVYTPTSPQYQEISEEIPRNTVRYIYTTQLPQTEYETLKHSPQVSSYFEPYATTEKFVTTARDNYNKENQFYQFGKPTVNPLNTLSVPLKMYETTHSDISYTTSAPPNEQLTQYTLPHQTEATLHETLDTHSNYGQENRYRHLPNVHINFKTNDYYKPLSLENITLTTVSQNVYNTKSPSASYDSSGTTVIEKYTENVVPTRKQKYFNNSDDIQLISDHSQRGNVRNNDSKNKLIRNFNNTFQQQEHSSIDDNPLRYTTYESTRTFDHSTAYIPLRENEDKNVFILSPGVTSPTPQVTSFKKSRFPSRSRYNSAYAVDSHIPIPTHVNTVKTHGDHISNDVPATTPIRHNNEESYTKLPTPNDNYITTVSPPPTLQQDVLNKGPTSKQPTSATVTRSTSAEVSRHGDFEETGRAGRLNQLSTSYTKQPPTRGVPMTVNQRVEPSSAPAAYTQQPQNQQPLSPAQNQVAYNSSRQEYDQAQYDPYYNLYDDEVELYRDVDYSQYNSNTGPSSNVQYRGQNYKQALVPQREQKSPSYAQPTYNNQDVYGQTITAQDYDKNYNTPADDQYQQNVAVQQPVKPPTRNVMRQRERGGSTQQTTQSVESSHFDNLWTPVLLSTQTPKSETKQTQAAETRGNINKNIHEYSTKAYTTESPQARRPTQSSKDIESQSPSSFKLDVTKSHRDSSHRGTPPTYTSYESTPKNVQGNKIPARSRTTQTHKSVTEQSPTTFKSRQISGNIREQARKKENSFAISSGGNADNSPLVRISTATENSLSDARAPVNYNQNSAQNSEIISNFPTSQRLVQTALDIDDSRNVQALSSYITERTQKKNVDRATKLSSTSRQPTRPTTERFSDEARPEVRTNVLSGPTVPKDRTEDIDSSSQSAPKSVETDPSSSLSRNSIIQTESATLRSRGRGQSQQRKQQTSSCSESFETNVNVDCKDKPQMRVRPVTASPDSQSTPGQTRGSAPSRTRGSTSYTTTGTAGGAETVNRGTPASVRSRPTLKPSTAIVSKASEFIDIYKFPPARPDPVYPTPQPDKTAAKCRKDVCLLPDCSCGGKDIPGGLAAEELPQIVLLTFDDAVNDLNKGLYSDLFEKGRKNPNGCPITATYYVSHEWTDYSQVQNLYAEGHEMASHSVSHSFGEKFSQKKWTKEIAGQREILAAYGGVKLEDIRGMRAPFLAVGGNKMFKMLYDSNFTYDSSMPVYENKPPSWPYTLDYKLFHDCMIPPCPTRSYPGVWEVPMVMWQDLNGGRCSMGDACSNPPTADGVYKMLIKNFERHYTTNRAPFGLFYHAAWFTQPHHKEGFIAFLDTIVAMQDVWLVTNWQAIQWVRDPTPISRINSFQPFQCNYPERPKKCNNPKVCNLWHKSGVRYMRTCQPCPDIYPWTGKTGVRNSRVDNEIVEES